MQLGRREIFTSEKEITYQNIIPILRQAIITHEQNRDRINFLIEYEEGNQPIIREKAYRSDINCQVSDNVAAEVTDFKCGFMWSNPITFVQRGLLDGGSANESRAIGLLNECYDAEYLKSKSQKLGRYVEICGVGYTYTDINTEYQDGESYFDYEVLDPRFAFVIRSSYYVDHRIMAGVTYREDENTHSKYFTVFTKDTRFEIKDAWQITNGKKANKETWEHTQGSGEINPMSSIPIVEWIRNYDRLGAWERHISEMDNLNILVSDFSNDVEQNTMAIWHTNDVDFPEDRDGNVKKPVTNDWLQTYTTQDGKTPFVTPLAVQYDYNGMLANIINRRSTILQKCHVPVRNDNSGGSTGLAMDSATGWNDAENIASMQQAIMEGCRMEEAKLALIAIKKSNYVPEDSPLLNLKVSDIQPSVKRNKNYDLATKINAFATGVSHGINGEHMLKAINAFEDVNQVWDDSKDGILAYQNSIFNKQMTNSMATSQNGENEPNSDRIMQDLSDQVQNSPILQSNN